VVSFLFQCQQSPTPGLHPVTCPNGGGTFLMGVPTGTAAEPAGTRATGIGLSLPSFGTRSGQIRGSVARLSPARQPLARLVEPC